MNTDNKKATDIFLLKPENQTTKNQKAKHFEYDSRHKDNIELGDDGDSGKVNNNISI